MQPMGIEIIVFLVISAIAWLINTLLQNRQEEPKPVQRPPGQRPVPPPRPAAVGERSAVSDIDRFLQEIDRLRRKKEEEILEAQPVGSPPPPMALPAPSLVVVAPPPPRSEPNRPRPRVRPVQAPFVPQTVPLPGPKPALLVADQPVAQTTLRTGSPVAKYGRGAFGPVPPSLQLSRGTTTGSMRVADMLRTPQSLRSAILLRTILDAPRCRQPVRSTSPLQRL